MMICNSCGAGLAFDPATQKLKCSHCDSLFEIADESAEIVAGELKHFDSIMYTCPQCGAEIINDDNTAATFCNFCGASVLLEQKAIKMAAPHYVLPFKKTKEECQEIYKKFVKKAIYAPSYFTEESQVEKLRGIYMPYWIYEFDHDGMVKFGGKKSYRRGDYIITDTYELSSNINAHYKGACFDASSDYSDELSNAIAPYSIRDNKPFSAAYLSGFYADVADVSGDIYKDEAREIVAADISNRVTDDPIYRTYNADASSGNVAYMLTEGKREMSYFPVWFMAVRNKEYVSYAVINGQTGKVAADIPIAFLKYVISSLLLAVPIALFMNFTFLIRPRTVLVITIAFSIICWIIANSQLNLLYTRRNYLNDLGLMSVRGNTPPPGVDERQVKVNKKHKKTTDNTLAIFAYVYIIAGVTVFGGNPIVILGGFLFIVAFALVNAFGTKKVNVGSAEYKKIMHVQPFRQKLPVIIKPIVAIGMAIIVLMMNPYQDEIYYGSIMAIFALLLVTIFSIVKIHNQLTKRLPRQFGKRGGDEYGM